MQHGRPERHSELTGSSSALSRTPAGPAATQQTSPSIAWCIYSTELQQQEWRQYRPAGSTERSAAKLDSKPSRDCLRLLDGEAMLRRRVLLLVRDTWRAPAGSLLLRLLLVRDSPLLCALASRSAVSRRVIRDFRPCCQAARKVSACSGADHACSFEAWASIYSSQQAGMSGTETL